MCICIYVGLEAREEVDEERMARRVGHFEDALFGKQRFNFITSNNVTLLQRFNGKVLVRVAVLGQYDL